MRAERSGRKALALLFIVAACLLAAAVTASSLSLSEEGIFTMKFAAVRFDGAIPDTGGEWIMLLFRGTLGLLLFLLPVYIVLSFATADGRSRLAADGILLVLLLGAAHFLRGAFEKLPPPEQLGLSAPFPEGAASYAEEGVVLAPPGWLTFIAAIMLSALVGWCVVRIRDRAHARRLHRRALPEGLDDDACATKHVLIEGGPSGNEIVRLYSRMITLVSEERGIALLPSMTPREFEKRLILRGLPPRPLATLTRLFERVRYGSSPLGREQEEAARSSLSSIENACRAREAECGDA